jgi:hypothetical protein
MQLGLFTPGAFIWPVHRSFEAFLASLATPAVDVDVLADGRLYPARERTESVSVGMSAGPDARFTALHRELYEALLRPERFYEDEPASLPDFFWPDLQRTSAGDLLSAFFFHFVQRSAAELPVAVGLAVLRGVFFNHLAEEPELWLHAAMSRLEGLRCDGTRFRSAFLAPVGTRIKDLSFTVVAGRDRSPRGTGWLTGRARLGSDGRCQVDLECMLDPSLVSVEVTEPVRERLAYELRSNVRQVFGWGEEVAA